MAADKPNLPALQSGGKVAAIVPTNFSEVVQIAGAIVRAGMAPKAYEGNTEKATVAILAGLELGLTPFAALQSIAIINGTPSVFGDGLVALVRASGLLEDIQETLEVDEQGVPQMAICRVKRKGEATWGEQIVTRPMCAKAGWLNKQGPWTATPGRMMAIRARAWAFRDRFADVLRGLKSAEELQDMVDVTPANAPPEPQRSDFVDAPKTAPAATSPHSEPTGDGQPATTPPAGVDDDRKPEVVSKPGVTDVVDQNEQPQTDGEPTLEQKAAALGFQPITKKGPFYAFSDEWLDEIHRTPAEARVWRDYYWSIIDALQNKGTAQDKKDIADTLAKFDAIMQKEGA